MSHFIIGMSSKSVSRRRNAIANKVLKNVPEICDIKIICDGKEVIDQMTGCNSSCSSDSRSSRVSQENESCGFVPLMRFVPNPIWLFRPRFWSLNLYSNSSFFVDPIVRLGMNMLHSSHTTCVVIKHVLFHYFKVRSF